MKTLREQFKNQSFGIIPMVTFQLAPGARIVAHPHTMLMKNQDVRMTLRLLTDFERKLAAPRRLARMAVKAFAGQFVTAEFTNRARDIRAITLHPEHGGSVVWIDLNKYRTGILCKKGSFLASTNPDVHVRILRIDATPWQMLFADQEKLLEYIVSRNQPADNHLFLNSRSSAVKFDLKENETRDLASNALLAATGTVKISMREFPASSAVISAM